MISSKWNWNEVLDSFSIFLIAHHQINLNIFILPYLLLYLFFINLSPFLLGKEKNKLERGKKMHEKYKCWKSLHVGDYLLIKSVWEF